MIKAWDCDEFVLDPSRITIYIGATGIEGDAFQRSHSGPLRRQINKTSRNTVLFTTTIGTTRSSVAYLVEVLVPPIARDLEAQLTDARPSAFGRSAPCCG
jgi:arginine decarboxylase